MSLGAQPSPRLPGRGSRKSRRINARERQTGQLYASGVLPDYEAVRAQAVAEAEHCPYCEQLVHSDNWRSHMVANHAEEWDGVLPVQSSPRPLAPTLTAEERIQLAECESVIHDGLNMFVRVGIALETIREGRLYRETHTTFDAYVRERWQINSRQSAEHKIIAARIAAGLSKYFDTSEVKQSHVLPLSGLSESEAAFVWQVIRDTAGGGRVTTSHVKSVVNVLKEALATGAVDDGDGASIPVAGALQAAITEETYERLQRQREHIAANAKGEKLCAGEARVSQTYRQDDGCYVTFRVSPEMLSALRVGQPVRLVLYTAGDTP